MRLRAALIAPLVGAAMLAAPTQPTDTATGDRIVTRASTGAGGVEGHGLSGAPDISADGRYVAFQSRADLPTSDPAPTPAPTTGPQTPSSASGSARTPSSSSGPVPISSTSSGSPGSVEAPSSILDSLRATSSPPEPAPASPSLLDHLATPSSAPRTPTGQEPWRVYVRDLQTGSIALLSDPSEGDATTPSLSEDGRLVAYARSTEAGTEIVVVDRDADGDGRYDEPGHVDVRRVTGTAGDLRYQRTPRCDPPLGDPPLGDAVPTNWPCGPQLSADGSTLVFPARLSPDSPALVPYLPAEGPGLPEAQDLFPERTGFPPEAEGLLSEMTGFPTVGEGLLAGKGLAGEVVDFGSPTTVGKPATEKVEIRVEGTRPVEFRGVSVAGGAGAFRVSESTCDGAVEPGGACVVDLVFSPTPSSCPPDGQVHAYQARLVTDAATPAGRTELPVVAECRGDTGEGEAVPSSRACPAPKLAGLRPRQVNAQDGRGGHEVVPAGAVELGQAALLAHVVDPLEGTLENGLEAGLRSGRTRFVPPPDCSLQLVQPPEPQRLEDQPEPCVEGRSMAECTAYVLFRPEDVRPSVGTLRLGEVFRFAGTGVRNVVVARGDLAGSGSSGVAAEPGRTESRVVSVDGKGRWINGTQPTVSADGRYVAFTSSAGPGRTQVYVRDTGQGGDGQEGGGQGEDGRDGGGQGGEGGDRPGKTVLASYLPRTDEPPSQAQAAEAPSLSGDGSRVAFVAAADDLPDQVYVRDLTERRTVLVSRAVDAPEPADGPSWAPALSGDGTTVAFVSAAPDLADPDQAGGGSQAYVRYLPDLDGGGVNELVSVTAEGEPQREGYAALPAIDAIGRRTVFQTSAPLVSEDRNGVHDAYVHELLAHATLRPATLDFGAQPVTTKNDPRRLTFANAGPGPTVVRTTEVTGPFRVQGKGCAEAVVHRGESCQIPVFSAPTELGPHSGTLTVRASDGPYTASLVGTGVPAPVLTLTPPLAPPGSATTARGTNFPPKVKVTLTWNPGPGGATVTTDARGRFTVSVPIYPNTPAGRRTLVATYPGGSAKSTEFLVVPDSDRPLPDSDNPLNSRGSG